MADPINVILADDHPLVRAGIAATLGAEPDIRVVGEAGNGYEAETLCRAHPADVLLLDLSMPGPPVTELIHALHHQCPELRILVLTAHDDDAYVHAVLGAGVAGYILKEEAPTAIVQAIHTVMRGAAWFSGDIAAKLVGRRAKLAQDDPLADLTDRERQLLDAVAQGWDNARIASELFLAEQTVRNYISRLYDKIDATTRAEAIVWARERGLGRGLT